MKIIVLTLTLLTQMAFAEKLDLLIPELYPTTVDTRAKRAGGKSMIWQGNPRVFITPEHQTRYPGTAVNAVVMHEYCHLGLGHLDDEANPYKPELDADCCAAKELIALNLPDVVEDIVAYYNAKSETPSPSKSGHLAPKARAKLYQFCASDPEAEIEDFLASQNETH